jgi:hypothetical protein
MLILKFKYQIVVNILLNYLIKLHEKKIAISNRFK